MEAIRWSDGKLASPDETSIRQQISVNVYNKEEKSGFQLGKLELTSHRIIWHDQSDHACKLEISLSQITHYELRQAAQIMSGMSLASRQSKPSVYSRIKIKADKNNDYPAHTYVLGHVPITPVSHVQFEFEYGGHNEFYQELEQQLIRKQWTRSGQASAALANQFHSVGITGIQRKIQDKLDQQDVKIHDSFKDLGILMNQAKEMVELSSNMISKINKVTEQQSADDDDSEDMKNLKSYFLNMGMIDNPVTRESAGSKYYKALAAEVYKNMTKIIADNGCIMTLADVYCRLNRARGIGGLISPEDLLYACKELNKQNHELKYNIYSDLNLHVLEIFNTEANRKTMEHIIDLVDKSEFLTAYALSHLMSCSLNVAKKHLLDAEKCGKLCRDDTHMGLKFYKNLFLIKQVHL